MIPFEDAGDVLSWFKFELVVPLKAWRENGWVHLVVNYQRHNRIDRLSDIDGLVCIPSLFPSGMPEHELGYFAQGVN